MYLISFPRGFRKFDGYVMFPEHLDLTPFLAPRKEDYGAEKRRKDRVMGRKRERGRRGVRIGCMLLWCTWCVPFFLSWDQHGLMVYYSLEAITLRILRSLRNFPVGPQRIHGQSNPMENGATSKPAQRGHERERLWAWTSDTTVRLTTLEGVLHAKACMGEFE